MSTENDGCSEREEGEIVDDFEVISDYSIESPSYSGKSVALQNLLQDVSLSSISDTGDDNVYVVHSDSTSICKHKKRKRKQKYFEEQSIKKKGKYRNHRSRLRHKKSRQIYVDSSSDSDNRLDYHTMKQLKEAIKINTLPEIEQKSLRIRLARMIELDSPQSQNKGEQQQEAEALHMLSWLSDTKLDENINNVELLSENKVIKVSNMNQSTENAEVIEKEILDDEELIELRLAALKSAVIKKAAERKKRKEQLSNSNKKTGDINKENYVNGENNKIVQAHDNCCVGINSGKVKEMTNVDAITSDPVTEAEEFLNDKLKLNSELNNVTVEEDVDIMRAMLLASMSKRITSNAVQNPNKFISKRDEKQEDLLKKETLPQLNRQNNLKDKKLPTVKPLIINLNDSESDIDVQNETNKNQNTMNVDKGKKWTDSVTQFLRQQRAVVDAKMKNQNNMNKELPCNKSAAKLLSKSQHQYQILKQKLLVEKRKYLKKATSKTNMKNLTGKRLQKFKTQNIQLNSKCLQQEVNLNTLQKTLEDMQTQKNERLQIKGKYKELTPLLRNVNEAAANRKKCEIELKKLLEDLKKTRMKLNSVNEQFINLVQRLINEKEVIDRRPVTTVNSQISVPIKSEQCVVGNNKQIKDMNSISSVVVENTTVPENKTVESNANIDLTVQKYVSPLDIKNRGNVVNNPFTTFCPYEIFGTCKDPECKFSHCVYA